ncbi:type II toxin-antitoxin system HipA family toxin [Ruania rhizosphaerae]|uniref:type II toxin-antitoxin system HipA family toxin n=1 Tax=Ruania rhizosphaerae TaxID=1840413 RepID=UPI00135C2757|nr:type II toxin-antitoxin system HipA family toxin [Ruania rhizosphaerae]
MFENSRRGDRPVGKLDFVAPHGPLAYAEFTYHPDWLANGYALGPTLPFTSGPQVERAVPRPLLDAGPDRWGRSILFPTVADNTRGRTAHDGDYLIATPDLTRQGALRFSDKPDGARWLASYDDSPMPGVYDLDRLLRAVERYEQRDASDSDMDILTRAGSSQGGQRPKATIVHEGRLMLAKFPAGDDRWDVIGWEAASLELARRAGIEVPTFRRHRLREGRSVLLLDRFDRTPTHRIGYISALTLSGQDDTSDAPALSYAELAWIHRSAAADHDRDSRELYRRAALNVMLNNIDDHLRNHGYLRDESGWRLSPVFDINPWPHAQTAMPISPEHSGSTRTLTDLIESSAQFGITADDGRAIIRDVHEAVRTWPAVATDLHLHDEIELMGRAFALAKDEAEAISTTTVGGITAPSEPPPRGGDVWVHPHIRNGKHISGHWRHRP